MKTALLKPYDTEASLSHLADLCFSAENLLIEIKEKTKLNKRNNFRKLVGIHLLALMLSTSHSIHSLLKNNEIYASAILVRAMVEQLVNLRYIYQSSTYENLVRYLYAGDMAFIRNAKKIAKTLGEYNTDGTLDDFIKDALDSIKYRTSSSDALKKYNYPLKSMPNFDQRVKSIVNQTNELGFMSLYLYDYLTYSSNVHSTKDKVIEMTYAKTENDWFQAVANDPKEDIFCMINTTGKIVEHAFYYFSKQTRMPMTNTFHSIRRRQEFMTNITNYRKYSKKDELKN